MSGKTKFLFVAGGTALVALCAISNQSLWIDEATSVLKAMQPTLGGWWRELRADATSNMQLPLHFIYLWGWEKIFGHSEVALRAANVPMLFLSMLAAWWGFQSRPQWFGWFAAVVLCNAFTWYYVDEARPYLTLLAAATLNVACLLRAWWARQDCLNSRRWFPLFCLGLAATCATSLIAVPWAAAIFFAVVLLIGAREFGQLTARHFFSAILSTSVILALGCYYIWTLRLGARATDVGRTTLANLFFVLYEQIGLAGLGPGRNQIRTTGLSAFAPYFATLVLAGAMTASVVVAGTIHFVQVQRRRDLLRTIFIAIALPLVLVLLAGRFGRVRILGRHLTPLFPFIILLLAVGLQRLRLRRYGVLFVAIFFLAHMASALEIRFATRHERDDYRGAAGIVSSATARQRSTWWAADKSAGDYYRVPFRQDGAAFVISIINPTAQDLTALPIPDVIVFSKPDVYDGNGAIANYIDTRGYKLTRRLNAFEIWER